MKVLLSNPPWYSEDRLGIRAGSRWPFTVKRHGNERVPAYLPFPFFMAYSAAILEKNRIQVNLTDSIALGHTYEAFHKKIKDFTPDVVFIDSLSTLLNESLNTDNLVDLTNFFNRLTGSGKIIFMTGNPNEWNEEIHNALKMISDIHFKITRESMPGIGIVHNIYLEKFNGARSRYEPLTTFSVKPNTGLAIETSGVAF